MTDRQKKWIDKAQYIDLLRRWRFAPAGDPIFQNEAGDYYTLKMKARRREIGGRAHTRISKAIGWSAA